MIVTNNIDCVEIMPNYDQHEDGKMRLGSYCVHLFDTNRRLIDIWLQWLRLLHLERRFFLFLESHTVGSCASVGEDDASTAAAAFPAILSHVYTGGFYQCHFFPIYNFLIDANCGRGLENAIQTG